MQRINKDRAINILKEMISYPHPQNEMEKVRGFIAEVMKPYIEKLPFDRTWLDDRGNLISVKAYGNHLPPLVICTYGGSYPQETMTDAYNPRIVNGKEYGLDEECMWGRSTTEQLSAGTAMVEAITSFFEVERDLNFVFIPFGNLDKMNEYFRPKVPAG